MIDINNKPYTKETELKLDIFKRCFREWFPVFLNSKKSTDKVFIYDLFAGNGTDSEGNGGLLFGFCQKQEVTNISIVSKSVKVILQEFTLLSMNL